MKWWRIIACLTVSLWYWMAGSSWAWVTPDNALFGVVSHVTVAVASTSTTAIAAKSNRTFILLENISDTNIDCAIGATAVAGQGIRLYANGGSLLLDEKYPNSAINCIHASSGTKSLLVTEGIQ